MTNETPNSGLPKPCLGYPSRSAAIRAPRAKGLSNHQISEQTGIPRSRIGALAPREPKEPRSRPESEQSRTAGYKLGQHGHISISVNIEIRHMLRPFAAKRNLPLEVFITDLIEKIAEDGLADAVMDDGVK